MPDPVAEKSAFLCMYLSNHPDTLVAYAKWFGKVDELVKSAEMSAIDCKVSPAFRNVQMTLLTETEHDIGLYPEWFQEENGGSTS